MLRFATALLLALVLPVRAAEVLIGWEEAEHYVGQDVIVKGRILGVHCSPTACLLAFEPTFNRFTAVVPAERFEVFPPDRLDEMFSGKKVQVRGTIVMKERKPEIIVSDPADLKITMSERAREEREADAERGQAQLEMLDKLGQLLERIAVLAERMAATEERMDAVLAQIEQRTAVLAAQQEALGLASLPQAPAGWSPPPRPAWDALRTVKRGMTADQIQRLLGQPEYVENGNAGWATWYYGAGRTVSFDARGRAQAVSGFPVN